MWRGEGGIIDVPRQLRIRPPSSLFFLGGGGFVFLISPLTSNLPNTCRLWGRGKDFWWVCCCCCCLRSTQSVCRHEASSLISRPWSPRTNSVPFIKLIILSSHVDLEQTWKHALNSEQPHPLNCCIQHTNNQISSQNGGVPFTTSPQHHVILLIQLLISHEDVKKVALFRFHTPFICRPFRFRAPISRIRTIYRGRCRVGKGSREGSRINLVFLFHFFTYLLPATGFMLNKEFIFSHFVISCQTLIKYLEIEKEYD